MNNQSEDSIARWRAYRHYGPRRDSAGERTVETGIEIDRYRGAAEAMKFFSDMVGISDHVTNRVLKCPDRRRHLCFD